MRLQGKIGIVSAAASGMGRAGALRFARDIVRRTANAFGGLDFVWNHVGHPGPASIEGIDMADYELAMDLNLRTVLVTTEAAIPEMRARGGGALLYTASTSGIQGSAFSPVYSMAKFGIVGFVRALAKRLAPDKIRVNAVCPGPTATGFGGGQVPSAERKAERAKKIPLGRMVEPDEVASIVCWLASEECSFSTGAIFDLSGGRATY